MEANSHAEIMVPTADGPMLWGKSQANVFLLELEEARRYNDFMNDDVVRRIIDVLTIVMTAKFTFPYARSFVRFQFDHLCTSFKLFKYVLEFPLVLWQSDTNVMEIPFRVKAAMCLDNPKSARYHEHGEPLWNRLHFVFDKPEIWLDDPRLIVPISDDGLFSIPPTFKVCDDPLHVRIREREYKKIYNARWSVEDYL